MRNHLITAATLTALLFMGFACVTEPPLLLNGSAAIRRGRGRNKHSALCRTNRLRPLGRYTPHQGTQECARRAYA